MQVRKECPEQMGCSDKRGGNTVMQIDQLNSIIEAEVQKRLKEQQPNGNKPESKYALIPITNLWEHNGKAFKATLKDNYKQRLLDLVEDIQGFQLHKNTIEGRGEYVLYAMVPHETKRDYDAHVLAMRGNK